jgi:hypothetical protein
MGLVRPASSSRLPVNIECGSRFGR